MVGVPGRSKACKTCKKRKIACTLERPHCRICIKSQRECLGYEQERIFVLDDRTRKQIVKVESKEVTESTPSSRSSTAIKDSNSPDDAIKPSQLQGSIQTKNAYSSLWTIACPTTRSVYRQQIISEFLHSFTPSNLLTETPTNSQTAAKNWFTLLPSYPDFTTALEATVLSICTAKLGRLNNDPALVHESLKFYTQGLWELQRALYTPELMYKEETAASCMALVFYEVMECPDHTTNAWLKHIQGCAKLFEMRGPKAYSTEFGHEIFLAFRQMEIQQAIAEKRRTFLSSPDWLTHPWKGYTKPLSHVLLDLEAEMATLFSTGLSLVTTMFERPDQVDLLAMVPEVISIMQQAWKLDTRLQAFYKRLQNSVSGPLYWARMSNGFNRSVLIPIGERGEVGNVFPVAFQFESLQTARTCMSFWATQAILWSGMHFVYGLLSTFIPLSALGLPALDDRTNPVAVSKSICQSVEYCIEQSPESGPLLVVFPLKVAVETLGDAGNAGCEREFEWAKSLMERIGGSGIRLLKHIDGPIEQHAFIPTPDNFRQAEVSKVVT